MCELAVADNANGSIGADGIVIPSAPVVCYKQARRLKKHELEYDVKYIMKSNEPDPYRIVEFNGMHSFPNFDMAKLLDTSTGEEFVSAGGVVKYSKEICDVLDTLRPIEQWNYLNCNHVQIDEKYGETYKTFSCDCE